MKALLKVLIVLSIGTITGFTPLYVDPVYIPDYKNAVITFGNCSNPFISFQFPHLGDLQSYQPTFSADGRYNSTSFPGRLDLQKLTTIPYSSGPKRYYIEAGTNVKYCVDHDHTTYLNPLGRVSINVPVDANFAYLIWGQVVSQCHQAWAGNPLYPNGNGGWWKYEKWFASGDFPLTVNDPKGVYNFAFQNITICNASTNQDYGCGTNDLK
jgi:hypothetical protein